MNQYMDNKNPSFLNPQMKQSGSHMIMTNVHKSSKTKLINIDTKFQEEYNNSLLASITYNIPQQIHDVKSISVPFMEIPYSFYNFSKQKGNISFIVTDNLLNSEHVFTISDGQYTKDSLVTYLSESFSSANLGISIIEEYNKTKIIATAGNHYSFYWNVSVTNNETDYDKTKLKSRLGWYLGFREPVYELDATSEDVSILSEAIINIHTTNYVFLVVDEFQNHPNSFLSLLSDSCVNTNILARIQVENHHIFGDTITGSIWTNLLSDRRKYEHKTDIYKLKLQLVDEWSNLLDLNHLDFSVVLEVEYE